MAEMREMQKVAGEVSEVLAAMANPNRLMILCHLSEAETTVGDLAGRLGMSQTALSQQLARLRALRLVATRRDAQQIYYRLASAEVERLLATLYELYCEPRARAAS
jgi:ArsR family transcriptional regulator, virulence genes transcriptional regulator